MKKLKDIFINNNENITVWVENYDGSFQPIEINVNNDFSKEVNYGTEVSGHCILGMSSKTR